MKVQGKYDLVHMDYEAGGDDEVDGSKNGGKGKKSQKEQPEEKVEIKESKLHSKLQELIRDELYRNRSSRKIDYQILHCQENMTFSLTLLGIPSCVRICQKEFEELPRPAWAVGSYNSDLFLYNCLQADCGRQEIRGDSDGDGVRRQEVAAREGNEAADQGRLRGAQGDL